MKPLLLAILLMSALAAPAGASPNVVVTIKPVHALVMAVMHGVAEPKLLVKGSSSPHTYALAPSDAAALAAASIFFRVSPTLEPITLKVLASLPTRVQIISVMDAPGLKPQAIRRGPTFDRDSTQDRHADEPAAIDGHAWLDPDNANVMAAYIAQILSRKDPTHAALYRSNAEALNGRLAALAVELDRFLKPVADRPYIVFHDAMQYFERRFGLNAIGSLVISPEIPVSAKRLAELRRKITTAGAVCAFAEPQFSMALISSVVEDTGVRVGTLDPEAINLVPGADAYFTLMRTLAADLVRCLSTSA